jgi:hypothetical protein
VEIEQFDGFTKRLSGADSSRRQALLPQRAERQRAMLRRGQDGLRASAGETIICKALLRGGERLLRRRQELLPGGGFLLLLEQWHLLAQIPGPLDGLRRRLRADRISPVLRWLRLPEDRRLQ